MYCDQRLCVCLSVCLSVLSRVSKTTRPDFIKFSAHVTYGGGSVLLRRQCNTLCNLLLVLWMTSCFHIMQGIGQNQRRRVRFAQFVRWRHRRRSLLYPTVSC